MAPQLTSLDPNFLDTRYLDSFSSVHRFWCEEKENGEFDVSKCVR